MAAPKRASADGDLNAGRAKCDGDGRVVSGLKRNRPRGFVRQGAVASREGADPFPLMEKKLSREDRDGAKTRHEPADARRGPKPEKDSPGAPVKETDAGDALEAGPDEVVPSDPDHLGTPGLVTLLDEKARAAAGGVRKKKEGRPDGGVTLAKSRRFRTCRPRENDERGLASRERKRRASGTGLDDAQRLHGSSLRADPLAKALASRAADGE